MEEADAMVANANKVLDLANAHKSEALATQMRGQGAGLSGVIDTETGKGPRLLGDDRFEPVHLVQIGETVRNLQNLTHVALYLSTAMRTYRVCCMRRHRVRVLPILLFQNCH